MKSLYSSFLIIFALISLNGHSFAQFNAMDFQMPDCNGNDVHLFSDLDAGQAVVLFFYMPSCSTCIPPAANIQAMAEKINSTCPGMVKGYVYSYQNSTSCTYTASWVTSNNLEFYVPMGVNGAEQVANYGGFGMPTVVLLGGTNHDVLWLTDNFVTADTTTMRDLILGMACVAGLEDNQIQLDNLEIFPNPANDIISINFSTENNTLVSIEVIDIVGKLIIQEPSETVVNGKVEKTINVNDLPKGNYLIKINANDIITTRKIAITH